MRQKKNEELMAAGVTIEDPATTYIDEGVIVGADTVIHPGVHLEGKTEIGQACEIHAGVRIINSTLDNRVTVQNFCVINGSRLGPGVTVGPFVHMRPDNELHESVRIGNFVELKKSVVGKGSKADICLPRSAVIGRGQKGRHLPVITTRTEHRTIIEDAPYRQRHAAGRAVTGGKGGYVVAVAIFVESVRRFLASVPESTRTLKLDRLTKKVRSKK